MDDDRSEGLPHLGRLVLDASMPVRDRGAVAQVTSAWRLAPDGVGLEPAVITDLDAARVGVRLVVRRVLAPRGIGLVGTVVLELPEGLAAITATGSRVGTRWLSGPSPPSGATTEVAECRVIRLADRRPRTAPREPPWVG